MSNMHSGEGFPPGSFFKKIKHSSALSKKDEMYKEELRQKLLAHYDNITTKKMSKGNIFAKLALFAAALLIIGVAAFYGANYLSSTVFPKNLGLELFFTEGVIEYQHNGVWATATPDTKLSQGDVIKVADNGKAIINVDDGSAIRLNGGSQIILTSLNPKNVVITTTVGEVYARVAKSNTRQFIVAAQGVEYKAMGTAYRVTQKETKKGVETFASKVAVVEGTSETIVEQGNKYYLVNTADKTNEKKIQPIVKDEDIKNDTFIDWNKAADEANSEYKEDLGIFEDTEAPALAVTSPKNGKTTTASSIDISGNVEKGAKVLINGVQVENSDGKFSHTVKLAKGYNTFTVKALDKAGNLAKVIIHVKRVNPEPKPTTPPVTGAYISLWKNSNDTVSWKVSGFYSENGFKVVWSKSAWPTYPTRSSDEYQYHSNPGTRTSDVLSPFDGSGTYYVRVCEYTGGGCGKYSNQVTISL